MLGGTGLVEALAKDYIALNNISGSVEWVCNHSRNTQLALLSGHIDIALTYEREQEEIAVLEGWAENAGCIFHDHFCLVGPEHDPANVKSAQSIEEAFDRIAATQSTFHSRDDGSATAHKDHEIWRRCHRSPWTDSSNSWFVKTKFNPADAITNATKSDAYKAITVASQQPQTIVSWITRILPVSGIAAREMSFPRQLKMPASSRTAIRPILSGHFRRKAITQSQIIAMTSLSL